MTDRQFVSIQFNPWDQRAYTYHNDGIPVVKGDKVRVQTRNGEAEVTVVRVFTEPAPDFETKPIINPQAKQGELL